MTHITVQQQLHLLHSDLQDVPQYRWPQLCRVYDRARGGNGWNYHVDPFTRLPFAHKFNRVKRVHSFLWHPGIDINERTSITARYQQTLATV